MNARLQGRLTVVKNFDFKGEPDEPLVSVKIASVIPPNIQ